ncbi:MAG: 50S ribosomal protein L4 [Candidatus Komeilibacteria bacterium]
METKIYNQAGEVVKSVKLIGEIFSVPAKPTVLQEVVRILNAQRRPILAHTKGRSDVQGGGRKPWRQKGTGRARHGSIRSPLWRGGGITFGPTKERNFTLRLNDKVKKMALRMVLSNKAITGHLLLLDKIELSAAKSKELSAILDKVMPEKDKKVVIALASKDDKLVRAAKNVVGVSTLPASSLNVLDLLRSQYLLMTEDALAIVTKLYK